MHVMTLLSLHGVTNDADLAQFVFVDKLGDVGSHGHIVMLRVMGRVSMVSEVL